MSPDTKRIAAAIFDFDGTLVDTMPMHFEAYRRVLADLGYQITRADFDANVGGTGLETIGKLLKGRPSPLSNKQIHDKKKQLINQVFATEPITVLETAKLLDVFHGNLPIALASSGARAGIEVILTRLNWHRYFSAIVTGEDVVNGKPAPDLFLVAAQKLNVNASDCVVFEDTQPGIAAATAAGMLPFNVTETLAPSARGHVA